MILGNRRPHALPLLAPLVVLACLLGLAAPPATTAVAAGPSSAVATQAVLDVATARAAQDGRTATVRGYVVG